MDRSANLSRRQFFAKAASVLAVPVIIPSGVLAAPGRPGANDRVAVGGIGIGRRGGQLLGDLKRCKDAQFVAVADVNYATASSLASRYNAEAFRDYRNLLERKDIDAIITATPDHWHALVSIHACQVGKDVYVEKPMTLTIVEGRRMVEAARKYGRIVQCGSQQRSMAVNRVGCELVRTGAIGKIQQVIAHNYPSPWECALPAQPVPEGLDWDFWCGPVEPVPYNKDIATPRANPGWISFRPFSGGEMTGWGAHGLDQVQWALGMDESGPLEIWTEGPKFDPPTYTQPESQKRGDEICSKPTVFMRYAGDILMELGNGPAGGAIFIGEKGKITIDRGRCVSDPPELAAEALKKLGTVPPESHMENWIACIKSRQKPVADVEIGHRSTTVCHLGNIARWVGRRLRWDPVKEQFDVAEANALLDRKRRKGYELPEKV